MQYLSNPLIINNTQIINDGRPTKRTRRYPLASSRQTQGGQWLKTSEYATPILGLIFLRFASLRYNRIKPEIDAEIKAQKNSRLQQSEAEIAIAKCGLLTGKTRLV